MSNQKKQNSTRTKEIDAVLKRAHAFADYWEGRKRRASERLDKGENQQRAWHFALLGLHASFDRANLAYGYVRQVVEPPGEVELAGALKQAGLFSTVARYTRGLAYELVLPVHNFDEQAVFDVAWWIASTLRIKTRADFIVPVAADFSWSTIPAAPANSVQVILVEDQPRSRILEPDIVVSMDDPKWVDIHYLKFADLAENERFRMASEAMSTHHQQESTRMMAAHLWAGIEALFGIQAELRFRLAALIATLLEEEDNHELNYIDA